MNALMQLVYLYHSQDLIKFFCCYTTQRPDLKGTCCLHGTRNTLGMFSACFSNVGLARGKLLNALPFCFSFYNFRSYSPLSYLQERSIMNIFAELRLVSIWPCPAFVPAKFVMSALKYSSSSKALSTAAMVTACSFTASPAANDSV